MKKVSTFRVLISKSYEYFITNAFGEEKVRLKQFFSFINNLLWTFNLSRQLSINQPDEKNLFYIFAVIRTILSHFLRSPFFCSAKLLFHKMATYFLSVTLVATKSCKNGLNCLRQIYKKLDRSPRWKHLSLGRSKQK